jgi:CheY-like chemotaxis protein
VRRCEQDLRVPGLTDRGLPRASRSRPAGPYDEGRDHDKPCGGSIPILVLTDRGGPDATADGVADGADDYIRKPFSSRELVARLRTDHELHRGYSKPPSTRPKRKGSRKG